MFVFYIKNITNMIPHTLNKNIIRWYSARYFA